jgi:hypothetical protein
MKIANGIFIKDAAETIDVLRPFKSAPVKQPIKNKKRTTRPTPEVPSTSFTTAIPG